MNDEIKVSIICTAFNHAKYIRQTFDSFLKQKLDFKYEIIVNDDASTDGTTEIVREYAERYPDIFIPVYHGQNMYRKVPSVIQAFCTPLVHGKYIAFCEGDDYWSDPEKLALQVEWMDTHPDYSACVHNTKNLYCDTGRSDAYNSIYCEDRDIGFSDVISGVGGIYHTSSVLIKSELVIDPPDFYYISTKHHVGDHPMAIWCAMNGKIRYIDRQMSVYRSNSGPAAWSSQMRENSFIINRLNGAVEMYTALILHLSGKEKELAEKALLNYKWELLQAEGRYLEMKRPPYSELTRSKAFTQRLWLDFKLYFPRFYVMYMVKNGRENSLPNTLRKKYL